MASTEKAVTLWLYRAFAFLFALSVLSNVAKADDDVRKKTLTFHPSLHHVESKSRDIVLPTESLDQDVSLDQHVSELFAGDRVKRQAPTPQSQVSSVRGVLPPLPANSTSVVSQSFARIQVIVNDLSIVARKNLESVTGTVFHAGKVPRATHWDLIFF
ncbi:hypothetical protein DAPPUDRAFT_124324 [Daphnia pulex]|uniref:Uncharacterized protein n=1 Tax=Daphnia pulex TaxID=6669 RepID=E9I6I3_DAPPU|nr:hypothetical protein DAPPUDRAFT_124324 [Daphnia pulex]|eukprot:EFX60397.1 hypothetical protein DAPPUDRAFT_124324 [Daphnia pulex]